MTRLAMHTTPLALVLLLATGPAADLHALVFHAADGVVTAAHSRLGQYCASHGEAAPRDYSPRRLRAELPGVFCPLCAHEVYVSNAVAVLENLAGTMARPQLTARVIVPPQSALALPLSGGVQSRAPPA